MMKYPIAIIAEAEGDYGVLEPGIPGCFTVGDTIGEAITNAHEAIECHLEGMLMDECSIPVARAIEEHQVNPDYADVIWAIATIDFSKLSGKAKRINITMPEAILSNKVDHYASEREESRLGLLQVTALAYIAGNS